jgi:8-oxo-dGTP pyrophosphatase MutT (NUDIX family)
LPADQIGGDPLSNGPRNPRLPTGEWLDLCSLSPSWRQADHPTWRKPKIDGCCSKKESGRMISIIYKVAYSFLKIYWFIFRPKTRGVICLILSGDELLLIRHSYGRPAWTLSGGGFKKNETKEEAVKREVKEELGLEITPEYVGEFTHHPEHRVDTVFCFVAKVAKEEPKIDHLEIKEAKWCNINNLPEDHSMNLQRVISMYRR